MAYVVPTATDFKAQFVRDFPYAPTPVVGGGDESLKYVMDADINSALLMAGANINEDLFGSQGLYTMSYCLLAAHYLVMNIRASSEGLRNQYEWNEIQKSGGSVQASFNIPDSVKKSPYLSMLTKTTYGAQYLSLILPYLCGHVAVVEGASTP